MRVYLDHNATTPLHPGAREAMMPYLGEVFGNPSSPHSWGQQARADLETARNTIATLIGAERDEIIFTSGGTESINLALAGVMAAKTPGRIVTTTVEHPAVTETLSSLEAAGHDVVRLPVDENGRLDPDELEKNITPGADLVSVMLANHEVGTLQPVAEAAQAARRVGAVFHSDAVQALGKVEIDVNVLGVDLLSLCAHKAYGPKGIGALYVRQGTNLAPTLLGGKQEKGLRAGTENVAAAVGFAAAAEIVVGELDDAVPRLQKLSRKLFDSISSRIPGLIWNARNAERVPGAMSLTFPGPLTGEDLLISLDLKGVAVSLGAACSSGVRRLSPVLAAMGVSDDNSRRTIRLSLGRDTDEHQINYAAAAIVDVWEDLSGLRERGRGGGEE